MKRTDSGADACTFDPWTAPAIDAHRLRARHIELQGTVADPLKRWHAARIIAQHQASCQADDLELAGRSVMGALVACLTNDLAPPPWLAQAFVARVEAVLRCDVKTWSDVFGRPWPQYTRAVARRRQIAAAVAEAVRRIRETEPNIPTTRAGLFARGAAAVPGVSGSLAEKLHYSNPVEDQA